MDSVIVDFMSEWLARYNRDYQDSLCPEDLLTWEAHRYVKPECGKKIYHYISTPGFYLSMKPLPGAVETLARLSKEFDLVIVTNSPLTGYADKERWVKKYLPFIPRENLIFSRRKDLILGDLLFDDAPPNIQAYLDAGRHVVAMDYPYNRNLPCPRVRNWQEFEEYVHRVFSSDREEHDSSKPRKGETVDRRES